MGKHIGVDEVIVERREGEKYCEALIMTKVVGSGGATG